MKVALHVCCGPCLLEPFDALVAEGAEAVVVYYNPNIHPAEEYERRELTLLAYAKKHEIPVVVRHYDPESWLEQVGPYARTRAERCRACYRLRFTEVARWAAENGFEAVATTLTVSPYQDAEAIADEGRKVCATVGLHYLERDFRDRYPEATRRSRDEGMYRQNYCGCVMSDIEARQQRAARKAQKRADRNG